MVARWPVFLPVGAVARAATDLPGFFVPRDAVASSNATGRRCCEAVLCFRTDASPLKLGVSLAAIGTVTIARMEVVEGSRT